MPLSNEQIETLALFNVDPDTVEDFSFTNVDGQSFGYILLCDQRPPCPDCHNEDVKIKGYELKRINYGVLADRKLILIYRARRYICPVCRRTFYEPNPFCYKSMKISAMTVKNVLRDLKSQSETFTSVAQRYHISPTSVASIFDQHVQMDRLPLPEMIIIDETYAFVHKGEKSKYVFTILDYVTQEPIDILPSRKLNYLKSYFLNIPKEERDKVKMFATDMNAEYRTLIRDIFPKTIHSADRFHVTMECSRKTDDVRKRVMKKIPKHIKNTNQLTPEYYLLKEFSWLIFKRPDAKDSDGKPYLDPNRERRMNRKLQRMLNYYDIRVLIEAIDPDLKAAWRLKDYLVDFYSENTYDTAPEALRDLIHDFSSSNIEEMRHFGRTLRNWSAEIINSFIVVGNSYRVDKETGQVVISERKLNTGILESRNSIIKTIKKNSNGYSCWDRFRNRCLYVLRHNAAPRLNPIARKEKK